MRKVYIQKHNGEFITSNMYYAWEGFRLKGYETIHFEGVYNSPELDSLDLTKDDIVCGSIPIVRRVFDRLEVEQPEVPSIPKELESFCGRRICYGTLKDIHYHDNKSLFIKPQKISKLFTGHVVSSFKDLIKTSGFPMETEILISDPVDFVSEYRGYVLNKKLIGLRHYKGDCTIFPSSFLIQEAIKQYTSDPIAYSIDFGITNQNKSLLVEINDAFALGNYGLNSLDYTNMIEARWDQIVSS